MYRINFISPYKSLPTPIIYYYYSQETNFTFASIVDKHYKQLHNNQIKNSLL